MSVSAIVASHGHAEQVEELVPLLLPQVDELVLIENLPGSVFGEPGATRVLRNARPLPFAANVNQGIAATSGEFVLVANPDAVPAPDAVSTLRAFMESHPRAGIAGPQMQWPDGRWQPSRRRFPTVGGTLVRAPRCALSSGRTPSAAITSSTSSRSSRCRPIGSSAPSS